MYHAIRCIPPPKYGTGVITENQTINENSISHTGTLCTKPPAVSCLVITATPPGCSRDVSRDVINHAGST